jgi:serine/threonine protein kinase
MIPSEKMCVGPGQRLGNYQICQVLGRGGFAEVYLGEHVYLGTRAALKVLAGPLDEHDADAFQREACLLAGLVHRHIVRVFDFGIQDGLPFLVLDYAPGGSLRKLHPKGEQLPLATVIEYVSHIASALQVAHNQHLIHRDVKPENILLGRDGQLLLADFGIAMLTQSMRSAQTQQIVGTPTYMAPEQLQGRACQASDQYALGILAYEWLCGRPPFVGSPTEIAAQHCLASPPSLRDRIASLPSTVEQIILRALAKDPAARFPSVAAFADALSEAYAASADVVTAKESASAPGGGSFSASPLPGQRVTSWMHPAREAAPTSPGRKSDGHDARDPFAETVSDNEQMDIPSSWSFFSWIAPRRPATSHPVAWTLVHGLVDGYFSSGTLLLFYAIQGSHKMAAAIAEPLSGSVLLLSLFCVFLAGWLAHKRTGKRVAGSAAGSLAGLVQQITAGVLGHALPGVVLPASFPLLLLIWGILGGVLGLLGTRRRMY